MYPEKKITGNPLILRIKKGDPAAFEELFFTHCQPLIRFAYRFINDISLAEDIVQNVYLKIWSDRNRLDPLLDIKNYLYKAVKNQALNHVRHDQIKRKTDENLHLLLSEVPTPEEIANSSEVETAILRAIEELPEKCRLIFSMNRFDGLTYSEIADILDLSVKTIETQMGRALSRLRTRLIHFLHTMILI